MSINAQVIPELAQWQKRLREQAGDNARRKTVLEKQRDEFRRRRAHGLVERHAERLVRIRGWSGPFPPDPESSEW